MQRYFFNLTHSEEIRDSEGVELQSLHSAKCHAVKMIAELLCEDPAGFWDADAYKVTVSDSNGLLLLSVEIISMLAPVLMSHHPDPRDG